MPDWICPNCNSTAVVPDSRRFHDHDVLHCMACTSWFTELGEPVCFMDDCGGDDVPDGEFDADAYSNKDIIDDLGDIDDVYTDEDVATTLDQDSWFDEDGIDEEV